MIYVVCVILLIFVLLLFCSSAAYALNIHGYGLRNCDKEDVLHFILSSLATIMCVIVFSFVIRIGTPNKGTITEKHYSETDGNFYITVKDLDDSFKFTRIMSVPEQDFYHLKTGDSINVTEFFSKINERESPCPWAMTAPDFFEGLITKKEYVLPQGAESEKYFFIVSNKLSTTKSKIEVSGEIFASKKVGETYSEGGND